MAQRVFGVARQVSMINKYNNFTTSKKVLCIATKYRFYRRDKQNFFQAKFDLLFFFQLV